MQTQSHCYHAPINSINFTLLPVIQSSSYPCSSQSGPYNPHRAFILNARFCISPNKEPSCAQVPALLTHMGVFSPNAFVWRYIIHFRRVITHRETFAFDTSPPICSFKVKLFAFVCAKIFEQPVDTTYLNLYCICRCVLRQFYDSFSSSEEESEEPALEKDGTSCTCIK